LKNRQLDELSAQMTKMCFMSYFD